MSGGWTKGPCSVSGVRYRMNGGEWQNINCYDEAAKRDVNVAAVSIDPRTLEGLADAELIAEAFNVANETGLSPRQLADQRGELLAALEVLAVAAAATTGFSSPMILKNARAAIAKATGAA